MELNNLIYSKKSGIATVVLNRPQALNALNGDLMAELDYLLDNIAVDEDVKAVIITGGERVFAVGADITTMAKANPVQALGLVGQFHQVMNKLENLPKPVIAAIAGMALGGGLELALACDLRLAAEGAKFALPEINLGIIPGAGGTQRLPRVIGVTKAKELIYLGDMIDAEVALQYGLLNRVVPLDMLLEEANRVAIKLTSKPGLALGAAKRVINNGINSDINTGNMIERESFAALFATEDQKEGMQAFIEKRTPIFKSK